MDSPPYVQVDMTLKFRLCESGNKTMPAIWTNRTVGASEVHALL